MFDFSEQNRGSIVLDEFADLLYLEETMNSLKTKNNLPVNGGKYFLMALSIY